MPGSARILVVGALIMVLPLPLLAKGGGGGGGKGGGAGGSTSAQPTTPPVNPQLMQARADRDKAQTALDQLTTKLSADYETSDEYSAAKKAAADANDALTAAKTPVITALKDSPDYKAALTEESDAKKALADLKASDSPRTQINAANDDLFKKSSVKGKLENQALSDDPGVKAAQANLQSAKEKLTKLKATFRDTLKDNPDYVAAKKTLDEAQSKVASMMPKPALGPGASAAGGY